MQAELKTTLMVFVAFDAAVIQVAVAAAFRDVVDTDDTRHICIQSNATRPVSAEAMTSCTHRIANRDIQQVEY
jgi:hypothetical protein